MKEKKEFKLTKRAADRTGERYGKLVVLGPVRRNKHSQIVWECVCDCGKKTEVLSAQLSTGKTKSCGCLRLMTNDGSIRPCHLKGKDSPYWRGHGDISAYRFIKIKEGAERRGVEMAVSIEYIWDLFLQQDRKCSLSGLQINFAESSRGVSTASLDRIDNTKGYIEDNVQWVHKEINRMKWDMHQDDFLSFCRLITENNTKENNERKN